METVYMARIDYIPTRRYVNREVWVSENLSESTLIKKIIRLSQSIESTIPFLSEKFSDVCFSIDSEDEGSLYSIHLETEDKQNLEKALKETISRFGETYVRIVRDRKNVSASGHY